MVFNHLVKHNGKYYPAGTDVPIGESKPVQVTTPYEDIDEEKAYTKTEISQMKIADLKALAESVGLENVQNLGGTDLKKLLVEHFGL